MSLKRNTLFIAALCACLPMSGCSGNTQTAGTTTAAETTTTSALSETAETTAGTTTAAATETTEEQTAEVQPVTNLEKLDMTKWQYNADDDVYYQIGISYCETPGYSSRARI